MNRRPSGGNNRGGSRPGNRSGSGYSSRPGSRPPASRPGAPRPPRRSPNADASPESDFRIVERADDDAGEAGPFRILIAVHRPRFRGRAERAAALEGWDVTALLNKQDPVGMVSKGPRPPDLLVLSGDFGRQKDYAIFRAVQAARSKGMKIIGMVDDCETAPEDFPESAPQRLCDVCLTPPYKTADLRALFSRLYEEMRGEPAPRPRTSKPDEDEDEDD